MKILDVHNVTKTFDGFVAVKNVSFSVEKGEICGIIGSNGAGKTTLVNMITGYDTPTNGDILFGGISTARLSPKDVKLAGIVRSFQIPQLFDHLTVLQNILIAISIEKGKRIDVWASIERGDKVARGYEFLESFGLTEFASSLAGEVPQGVRKLLDVAMAVVGQPSLIVLDEPTSGVSTSEKEEIMDLIVGRFRSAGVTTIFVEHDMELIRKHATNVVALYQGEIIGAGPTGEVIDSHLVRTHVIGATNQALLGEQHATSV